MREAPDVRRRAKRVKLGGSSSATVSEGMKLMDADLNNDIRGRATTPAQIQEVKQDTKDRLAELAVGSKSYAKEYRLKMVHRMLMRNIPLDTMAKELGVSIHTIMRDRKELRKRLQEEARNLDINHLIGDTLGFYQELQAMSLKMATQITAPMNMRLAAMRTALACKNDQFRFLGSAGVLDVLRYQAADNEGQSDIEKMVSITKAILQGDEESLTLEDVKSIATSDLMSEEEQEVQLI